MFKDLTGRTMEVYIDDMLIKSLKVEDHLKHLKLTFELLEKYQMKLNPKKCTFKVSSGKLLGYLVTQRRIEANPYQIQHTFSTISKVERTNCSTKPNYFKVSR